MRSSLKLNTLYICLLIIYAILIYFLLCTHYHVYDIIIRIYLLKFHSSGYKYQMHYTYIAVSLLLVF
jgi:hypothetical protein